MSKSSYCRAALAVVVVLLSGCQGPSSSASPTPVATPTANVYTGQTLPSKVERLEGTPLYTKSAQMAAVTKIDGAAFLLMAPQNPTEALLVVESGSTPPDLAGRPSQLGEFSGQKETLEAPELVKFVKDETGLDLKQEDGKVVVVRVSKAGSATPTPGAKP